jgi:hypothetical protein
LTVAYFWNLSEDQVISIAVARLKADISTAIKEP